MADAAAASYADRLLAALVDAGVHDVVVCPGSRSQALALAAARLAREDRLALHVRIDERSAGFLAVGLARETRAPVAIVVTSGTAVAELHPAMLEAHHADVPLIAITADRPPELQGIRSNQTTMQPGIFAHAARAVVVALADAEATPEADAVRIVTEALGAEGAREPGPVQLDVGFRDPLSGGDAHAHTPVDRVVAMPRETHAIAPEPGTVVVAGADAGPAASALAIDLGAPLVAEPSSSARFGPNLVVPDVVASELADEVRRVVVVGHPTLTRVVTRLVRRDDVEVVVAGRRGLENVRGTVVEGDLVVEGEPGEWARAWVGRWVQASRRLLDADMAPIPGADLARDRYARAVLEDARRPVTRAMLARAVWEHTWPHDRLVLGASRLIRVLDRTVGGKPITVHANRGLAGIDGTVSTAIGVALAHDRAGGRGVTRALMGDLTLLHDVGGFHVPADEPRPRLQIVVGNDGGGTIFDDLEVAGTADVRDFARVQRTPQSVDLASLAAAYGWQHVLVEDRAGLERALTRAASCLVEVRLAE
ncbi:2-succinyl-5-enolpyruvyl-6-hydroxy-3-cyclohexene-1-carboxylic-acid synthase [Agrococcus sp. SGAir0287]|uniref:2-succinyl-5-enolpyruvyl-6-hydroxy-3- cyclohexene-1-carboxylic-acid synthase n=1 Tax=Agrococcus sp. SGAir0287 TaxID=2070347 RepID=UPI0020C7C3D1|nr:2-succinyl-5-enolpyruvyl-6-hydroxy-3-cyclohexene-1-carboxylic-acid synthase [Agrococcus sp. SGAir0287]